MAALYSTSCVSCNQLVGPYIDCRTAYLVFAVVGFVISILILIPLILNLIFSKIMVYNFNFFFLKQFFISLICFLKLIKRIIVIIIDIIWIVPMFILSIYCAIYEARYGLSVSFNQGAFGAASVSFFFSNFYYNLIASIHMVI